MGSVSTIYNGVRTWLAGRALMDVALSDRSTNGVQNKVIKAKFDEVDDSISQLNSDLSNCWIIEEESHSEILATADGVKTVAQLLTEALTAFRSITIEANHGIKVTNFIIPYSTSSRGTLFATDALRTSIGASSGLYGSSIDTINNGIVVRRASFSQGNFYGIELTDNTVNFVNYNSVVPNSGQNLSITYDIYKKL